ncbi:MAG: TetR family transcriptional regulator [Streptosporangiales bacterium]|nr:TetR family transcriptional regulator [Streptosporangiales bacterium]
MTEEGAELRADARRNRERIIAAAAAVLAERGADAPMEEIARRAGVGVGTLYRRFPDRDALFRGVMHSLLVRLTATGRRAQAEEPDAWGALERFLRETAKLRTASLITVLRPRVVRSLQADGELGVARRAWFGLLDEMVLGAQREGAMRTDLGTGDVTLMIAVFTRRVPGLPEDLAGRSLERHLEVLLDGLRATPRRVLTSEPIHAAELEAEAMRSHHGDHQVTGSS